MAGEKVNTVIVGAPAAFPAIPVPPASFLP